MARLRCTAGAAYDYQKIDSPLRLLHINPNTSFTDAPPTASLPAPLSGAGYRVADRSARRLQ